MRIVARAGICTLLVAAGTLGQLSAQETAPKPKKVLTPEQQKTQSGWDIYLAQRGTFVAQANQAFDAEMAHEKTKPCKDAKSTYDFEMCYEREGKITETNYEAFTNAIREMLRLKDPDEDQAPQSASTGTELTAEERVKKFDTLESAWKQYRKTGTDAAYGEFQGGTEAPLFYSEADFMLVRSHMRELDFIYDSDLHH